MGLHRKKKPKPESVKKKTPGLGELKIRRMKLADLEPASYNPRQISDAALAGLTASVKRFGCVEPIVWNRQTGRVVGGHQRIKALWASDVAECDVVEVDLSEAEEKALNVTLNSPHIAGEWTGDAIFLLEELSTSLPEFGDLRLDKLLGELNRQSSDLYDDTDDLGLEEPPEGVEKCTCPNCGQEHNRAKAEDGTT